jgi:hypothetical protein
MVDSAKLGIITMSMSSRKNKTIFTDKSNKKSEYNETLLKVISIIIAIGVLGIVIFGISKCAILAYHELSYDRQVLDVRYTESLYPIYERRMFTKPIYRTDENGKRHYVRTDTDYYLYYNDGSSISRFKVSSSKYHHSNNILVRYKHETVMYTAKFPDEYKGNKELGKEIVEVFVDYREAQ